VSQPESGEHGQRVTQLLETSLLPVDSLYYLCGNRMMITDAISILRHKGIPGGAIFTETFF
jgi:ferredoxin-NADP reductase